MAGGRGHQLLNSATFNRTFRGIGERLFSQCTTLNIRQEACRVTPEPVAISQEPGHDVQLHKLFCYAASNH